jgi:ferric-dicitrate binding protein FerR (iron transport regulator)
MNESTHQHLVDLVDAVIDNTIDDAQIEQLRNILRDDPEARRQYLRSMNMHSVLHQTLRFNQLSEEEVPTVSVNVQRSAGTWRIGWVVAAYAALLLVATAIGLQWMNSAQTPVHPSTIVQVPMVVPVAVISEGSRGLKIDRQGVRYSAETGTPLFDGDLILTTDASGASIRFVDDQTLIVLSKKTIARFELTDPGKRIELKSGRLLCDVDQQPDGKPLIVVTHNAETIVLGTQFSVRADENQTSIDVKEGLVRIKGLQISKTVDARAGFSSRIDLKTITLEERPIVSDEIIVGSFTLFDTDTQKPIASFDPIPNGAILDLAKLSSRNLNIRANADPSRMGAVLFSLHGVSPDGKQLKPQRKHSKVYLNRSGEWTTPYMLAGDNDNFNPPKLYPWAPVPGRYTLTATPYANKKFHDVIGPKRTLQFIVIDSEAKRTQK